MTKSQKRYLIVAALALVLAAVVFLAVRSAAADAGRTASAADEAASTETIPAADTADEAADEAAALVFSDSAITASGGSGCEISGTALTIDEPGVYTVSGACADGSIKIKKGTTGVTLVLDGLDLTSAATAPITCGKSSEVTIVAASGTVNALADSAQNNDDAYPENTAAENAVIKCKDGSNVTLSGSGTLNITANGKNGIKSGATTEEEGEASLTIQELTLNIAADVNDAIHAGRTLNIPSGTLTIAAADDAIHADYTLTIGADGTDGPCITVTGCNEGLEAASLNIFSGSIDITATDDCLNAANSDLMGYDFAISISGGTIRACTSGGDGFDSNGSLTISGGDIAVWTANSADNQPLDADGAITITGGTVLAAGGSSGMGMDLSATQGYVLFGSDTLGGMGGFPGGGMQPPSGERPDDAAARPDGTQTGDRPTPPGSFGGAAGSASVTKGSTLAILSGDDTLFSADAPCDVRFVFFSSPLLTDGASYTLCAGGESVESAEAQTGGTQTGFGSGRPNGDPPAMPDGATPPEKPDGAAFDGATPPEKPDGTAENGQPGTPPAGDPPTGAPGDAAQGAGSGDL